MRWLRKKRTADIGQVAEIAARIEALRKPLANLVGRPVSCGDVITHAVKVVEALLADRVRLKPGPNARPEDRGQFWRGAPKA